MYVTPTASSYRVVQLSKLFNSSPHSNLPKAEPNEWLNAIVDDEVRQIWIIKIIMLRSFSLSLTSSNLLRRSSDCRTIFICSSNYAYDEMKIFKMLCIFCSMFYFHIKKSQIFTRGKYKISKSFPDRRRTGERAGLVTPSIDRLCSGENPSLSGEGK